MKVEVFYEYSADDKDFSEDCGDAKVLINGSEVDLPFEEDYPRRMTEAFVNGIILGANEDVEVFEKEVNGDW